MNPHKLKPWDMQAQGRKKTAEVSQRRVHTLGRNDRRSQTDPYFFNVHPSVANAGVGVPHREDPRATDSHMLNDRQYVASPTQKSTNSWVSVPHREDPRASDPNMMNDRQYAASPTQISMHTGANPSGPSSKKKNRTAKIDFRCWPQICSSTGTDLI